MIRFYRVGGCVRDALLGLKSKDIDFSVVAPSYEAMKAAILARGGQIFLETPQYATIRAKVPGLGAADFVLCRKDGKYSDGRRPDSVEMGTLEDDLMRRDFTVNALAESEEGEIIDLFGGREDLSNRILRCVGDTRARMSEDALRILRAVRFQITKGFFPNNELETFLLDWDNAQLLDKISIERIRDEMFKCFEFDSLETLRVLSKYTGIRHYVFSRNLKLVPTIFAK